MTIPVTRRAEIIRAVSTGLAHGTPLTVICEGLQAQGRFRDQSLYNWLRDDPEAKLAIEYARDLGFDMIANQVLEIADDASQDVLWDKDGIPHQNGAAVLRARVRIETRLKLLAKWDPRRYGELRTLKVEGEVQTTTRHVLDPAQLDEDGRASLRRLLEHAKAQGLLESPGPAIDAEFEELGAQEDVADR